MNKTGLLFIYVILSLCCPELRSQQDSPKDYILVLHSINFKETWTHLAYETIRATLADDMFQVKGEELQRITGVNTAIFCHDGGFVGSAETLQDTIKMAEKAIAS